MKRNALIGATLAAIFAAPAGAIGVELENVQITSYQLGAAVGDQPSRPTAIGQPGGYNPNAGALFLKNTNTPGATHPGSVGFLWNDGSVRLVNPSRTAPLTGLPATPAAPAPSLSPVGKPSAVAPVRR